MAYTSTDLAIQEYKARFWNESEYGELFPDSKHKRENYQRNTIQGVYENNGVSVIVWWEHLGHHQRLIDQKFFKKGKIYADGNCGKVIGTYNETE